MMAAGHPHCYVATTTVGYPVDLMNKTRKGLNHRGAAFMHCFTPCQKGWVYQTSMTVEIGRRVVEAGLFPVWEYDPAERKYHYFHPPVQRPVTDYLAMQGRFGHMLPEHIASIQAQANRGGVAILGQRLRLPGPTGQQQRVEFRPAEHHLIPYRGAIAGSERQPAIGDGDGGVRLAGQRVSVYRSGQRERPPVRKIMYGTTNALCQFSSSPSFKTLSFQITHACDS